MSKTILLIVIPNVWYFRFKFVRVLPWIGSDRFQLLLPPTRETPVVQVVFSAPWTSLIYYFKISAFSSYSASKLAPRLQYESLISFQIIYVTLWIVLLPPLLPARSSAWEVGTTPVLLQLDFDVEIIKKKLWWKDGKIEEKKRKVRVNLEEIAIFCFLILLWMRIVCQKGKEVYLHDHVLDKHYKI